MQNENLGVVMGYKCSTVHDVMPNFNCHSCFLVTQTSMDRKYSKNMSEHVQKYCYKCKKLILLYLKTIQSGSFIYFITLEKMPVG
jgi:hypothetical protein